MIEIKINNKNFTKFTDYFLELKLDSIASTFSFSTLPEFSDNFLQYSKVEIFRDRKLLLTGTIINEELTISNEPEMINISGYSLPGILEDCNIPTSLYPLQSDNKNMKEILNYILKPFGIKYSILDAESEIVMQKNYQKNTAKIDDTIKSYINDLISQRGLILSHNEKGEITIFKRNNFKNIVKFTNVLSYQISISAQALHSEITVMKENSSNNNEFTIKNPLVKQFRPRVEIIDNEITNLKEAAKNLLQKELSEIKFEIESTDLFFPLSIFPYENDKINIKYWIIESVKIIGNTESESYSYSCVPAKVYDYDNY